MDCKRKGCGHPLALHDPCSAEGCKCSSFVPKARKEQLAELSDIARAPKGGKR